MAGSGNISSVGKLKPDAGDQTSLGELLQGIAKYTMQTKDQDEINVSAVPQIGRTQSLNEVDRIHAEFGNVGGIVNTFT